MPYSSNFDTCALDTLRFAALETWAPGCSWVTGFNLAGADGCFLACAWDRELAEGLVVAFALAFAFGDPCDVFLAVVFDMGLAVVFLVGRLILLTQWFLGTFGVGAQGYQHRCLSRHNNSFFPAVS